MDKQVTETCYVILDDVTPSRGTIMRCGANVVADRGQIRCRWVGDVTPKKGDRAWHRGDIASAS